MLGFVVTDPDTMTLKEALGQEDRFQFLEAMRKELNDYISHRYWTIIHRKTVPVHKTCIPMVWSMKKNATMLVQDLPTLAQKYTRALHK